jgi:hypothetical protein
MHYWLMAAMGGKLPFASRLYFHQSLLDGSAFNLKERGLPDYLFDPFVAHFDEYSAAPKALLDLKNHKPVAGGATRQLMQTEVALRGFQVAPARAISWDYAVSHG